MRNLLGGIIGILIGSMVLVTLVGLSNPIYSWPYNMIWFLLSGSDALRLFIDGFFNPILSLGYILTWVLIGVIIGLFSKKGWNTLRSALWAGLILGILSLASILLQDAGYWTAPTRNLNLLYHFIGSILVSLSLIPSAIPVTIVIERVRKQAEAPIPDKIESICDCGAVFKSNPLICSECGNQLRDV
ncbi:MAG: hypothetical protein E4H14_07920 [Candidatus Thorarchaeota archaeon]|nr:MAG: hypothetical protein E4H14_07920 [Candidatus Thorarchaeota archaeon]